MSMDYLIKSLTFFMWVDTLVNVINRVRKLLIKLHHLRDIIEEERERERLREKGQQDVFFENHKNLDIPKNFTIKVYEHMTFNITYPMHPLTSIMKIKSPFEKISLNAFNISFEMLFNTMAKSYAMHLTSPKAYIEVNQQECASITNFKMEMRVIYKKCIRKRVQMLREMFLDINQQINFDYLHVNLTSNLFIWFMIFEQIYRKMKKEASIKNDLMKKILHTEFLRENLLKQEFEVENEHYLYETKFPSVMKCSIKFEHVDCNLFTKDDMNTMNVNLRDYQIEVKLQQRILTFTMYINYMTLASELLNQKYFTAHTLVYQDVRDERYDDHVPRKI